MTGYSYLKKFFISVALAAVFCSIYYFATSYTRSQAEARREMPVGKVNLTSGDTRWKSESQTHQFKTWEKQRLYAGDTLYAGATSRLGFFLGDIHLDLKPHTRVTLRATEENFMLETAFGQFEMHLPPGERMRITAGKKYLDLASVNGGRVNVQVEGDQSLRVQNIAGDLVVRTEGKTEYTVPEEEIFRAEMRD